MSNLPQGLTTGTWNLDASHSQLGFSVRHAGISKTRGRFGEAEGTLTVGESVETSSTEITIHVPSVDTRSEGRDQHLRSADFFDAENYPAMTFVSTSAAGEGDDWTLTGNLTIKDVTREVELEVEFNGAATDPFGTQRVGFSAETTINRKDFGLTWNAALETGGVLVSDKVKIEIEAEFAKA